MRRVSFPRLQAQLVNFRSGTLTDMNVEDCVLRNTEVAAATLRTVSVTMSYALARADYAGARLCEEVDLRGTELGISAGYESLRGTTMNRSSSSQWPRCSLTTWASR